jgi:hypothetical protein
MFIKTAVGTSDLTVLKCLISRLTSSPSTFKLLCAYVHTASLYCELRQLCTSKLRPLPLHKIKHLKRYTSRSFMQNLVTGSPVFSLLKDNKKKSYTWP